MRRQGRLLAIVIGLWSAGAAPLTARASEEEAQEAANFSEIDQMLFTARQAFRQRRFDTAITTCEKILRKGPHQLVALKIMGSGYFMLEEYDRARHVWETALQVAPDDPDIPKYMSRLPAREN